MSDSVFTSPTPASSSERKVAPSPLGLTVRTVQNRFPDIMIYYVEAGSGYDTGANPMTVTCGDGRLFFVENDQVTAMKVVGVAAADPGVTVPANTRLLLTTTAAGHVIDLTGGSGTVGGPVWTVALPTKVANYNASIDELVPVDPTGGTFTVTLPAPAAANAGHSIIVKTVSDSPTGVTIATAGGLIDGLATFALFGPRSEIAFISDGTNWMAVLGFKGNEVATFAALPAPASQPAGLKWYVESQRAYYHVVAGAWDRLPGGDLSWTTQATWFIDAVTGSNDNPGTALLPLASHAELEARLGTNVLQQDTDITIVGALGAGDVVNVRYKFPGKTVRYLQGAADTVNVAGVTLTAPVAINRATNVPQSFTASVSLDAVVGKKMVKTGGAGTWNVAWLAKAIVAGSQYRISPAVTLSAIPMVTPTVVTPTANDTFDVRTSPPLTIGLIEDPGQAANLVFNRFELSFTTVTSILMQELITFQECGNATAFSAQGLNTVGWRACKTAAMTLARPGAHTFSSCLVFGAISQQIGGSQTLLTGDTVVQGSVGGSPGAGAITATDFARVTMTNAATFDAAAVSILCQRGAGYRASGAHYGSGSVTQLSIENAMGWYTSLPTATGTTQDCLIGGLARSFSASPVQIPWTESGPLGSMSSLVLSGAAVSPISATKVGAYSAKFGEVVSVDPTGGAFTVTLPAISAAWSNAEITVENVGTSANVVTIAAAGGQTVDGAASLAASGSRFSFTLKSDGGTNWRISAKN